MRTRTRLSVGVGVAVLILASAGLTIGSTRIVFAAEPTAADRALATELFHVARAQMAEGKTEEACKTFEQSQRLDSSAGTLLNLAVCHEKIGRTATAWSEFEEARSMAIRDQRSDREALAVEHIDALRPRLSRLTVEVPADLIAANPALTIRRDGTTLPAAAWNAPFPVDPGPHRLEVTAKGYVSWSVDIVIGPDADARQIAVPMLIAVPAHATTPLTTTPPAKEEAADRGRAASPSPTHPRKITLPIAIGVGVTVVGLGVGTFFGVRAFSKKSESDDRCAPDCDSLGAQRNDEAKVAADVATVAFATAIVAGAVTAWLFFVRAPSSSRSTSSMMLKGFHF